MNTNHRLSVLVVLAIVFLSSVSLETKAEGLTQGAFQPCDLNELAYMDWGEVICRLTSNTENPVQMNQYEGFASEFSSSAEHPTVPWSLQIGGEGTEINDVATDIHGNVYITGAFNSANDSDAFVAKLDSNGGIQWSHTFSAMMYDKGHGVAIDTNGGVYVAGSAKLTSTSMGQV
jgi:hypothetical protein